MQYAQRLDVVGPSPTLALNAKAKGLAAKGVDVVSFAAGEPDFNTPEFIQEAAIASLKAGFTKYTATNGIPELRQAIVDKLKRENALNFSADQVLVTAGAKHALYNLFQALLSPGDEVVIFAPYWVSYPDMVALAGGKPVFVSTREENQYAPSPEDIARALTPRTKAVILNSPSNPTGAVYSRETLLKIAESVRRHECLLVTDDIYEKLLYQDAPFENIANVAPDLTERTVVVNGFSKAFAMTGWRLGYAVGPKKLIAGMQMIQDQSTSNTTSFVQKAGIAALSGPTDALTKMVAEFRQRRDLMIKGLNSIPGVRCSTPGGAFYAFANVEGLMGKTFAGNATVPSRVLDGSMAISEVLLDAFQVAAVPGKPFGAEGYLRLSFATSREIISKGIERISNFAQQIK